MSQQKQKEIKSGGYNVAWLIPVQALAWNIMFPAYLIGGGVVLAGLLIAYLTALTVVAKKMKVPSVEFATTVDLLEQYKEIENPHSEHHNKPDDIRLGVLSPQIM